MKQKIEGIRYDYLVEFDHSEEESYFEIKCIHKSDNRKSVITNVNYILSELIFPILDPDELGLDVDMETTMVVSKADGEALFKNAVSFLEDAAELESLEEALDDDKDLGGFNAAFEF